MNMDYGMQCLIDALTKSLDEICNAIKDSNEQLNRLNENLENVTGTFKDRAFLNVVASVYGE